MSEIQPFVFPDSGKRIYVIEHASGVVKVGYSAKAATRLRQLDLAARQMGTRITRAWTSDAHENARHNERLLIAHCARRSVRTTGGESGEYFANIPFDDARAYAEDLALKFPGAKKVAPREPEPCAAGDWADAHPLTAIALLYLVAKGEFRLIDSHGRDVTGDWSPRPPDREPPLPAQQLALIAGEAS